MADAFGRKLAAILDAKSAPATPDEEAGEYDEWYASWGCSKGEAAFLFVILLAAVFTMIKYL